MEQPAVTVSEQPAVRGAALRFEGEITPEAIGMTWGRLLLRCQGISPVAPPFGLHRKDGVYEACWPLPPGQALPEGLAEAEAPGGWYAVAVHPGAYDRMGETLGRILENWLPHSGFRRREGPVVERYLNDPRETAEEDLRTEVCVPVSPDPIE